MTTCDKSVQSTSSRTVFITLYFPYHTERKIYKLVNCIEYVAILLICKILPGWKISQKTLIKLYQWNVSLMPLLQFNDFSLIFLTFSWRRPLSYRNQSTDAITASVMKELIFDWNRYFFINHWNIYFYPKHIFISGNSALIQNNRKWVFIKILKHYCHGFRHRR